MKKILQTDLRKFEGIIDPESFNNFKTRLAGVKNPTWYSKHMLIDACTYILSAYSIAAGMEDLNMKFTEMEIAGTPFFDDEKISAVKEMMAAAMKP